MEETQINELKLSERPWYVGTGRIDDRDGHYVIGTKTKELAELILLLLQQHFENTKPK